MSVCTSLAITDGARAQTTPRFRVTDLANLNDTNISADNKGTMGINNKGQVVYTRYLSGNYRAWVWLPVAEYGFAANAIHNVGASGSDSIARDINENGKIAGVSGGLYRTSNSRATVWTLLNNSASAATMPGGPSEAHAINNDSPPILVGRRDVTNSECTPTTQPQAFSWQVGNNPLSLAGAGDFQGELSWAFDIRRNGDELSVGISTPCEESLDCYAQFDGTSWDDVQAGQTLHEGSVRSTETVLPRRTWAYGVNDDGNAVGWVSFDPDDLQPGCFPTAVFWDDPGDTTPIDLSEFLADEFDISRAFAINSLTDPQVVGINEVSEHAILWEYSSGWFSNDLNRSDSPPNYLISDCADAQWEITEAHDINDNGWIVALGTTIVSTTSQLHALLLTPVGTCPFDIDEDGDIDEDDSVSIYRFMINNPVISGACGLGIICRWDVNFDCIVDGDDMDAVLEYIENCETDPCLCEGGDGFGGDEGGLSAERFAAALAAVDPALTDEEIAFAWERFFAALN